MATSTFARQTDEHVDDFCSPFRGCARSGRGPRKRARRSTPRRAAQRPVAPGHPRGGVCSPATSRWKATTATRSSSSPTRRCATPTAKRSRAPDGLRRIQTSSVGLTVEEGDNRVSLRMDFSPKNVDLEVRVPRRTSVHASLVNGGDIVITGVTGEHELSNVNGDVVATDISGSAVLNSTNGDVRATLAAVDGDQVDVVHVVQRRRRRRVARESRRPTCSSRASKATCSRISRSNEQQDPPVVERRRRRGRPVPRPHAARDALRDRQRRPRHPAAHVQRRRHDPQALTPRSRSSGCAGQARRRGCKTAAAKPLSPRRYPSPRGLP